MASLYLDGARTTDTAHPVLFQVGSISTTVLHCMRSDLPRSISEGPLVDVLCPMLCSDGGLF